MNEEMNCTSCNRNIHASENFVRFRCPKCGDEWIVRCQNCKDVSVGYKCPKCGFAGP